MCERVHEVNVSECLWKCIYSVHACMCTPMNTVQRITSSVQVDLRVQDAVSLVLLVDQSLRNAPEGVGMEFCEQLYICISPSVIVNKTLRDSLIITVIIQLIKWSLMIT